MFMLILSVFLGAAHADTASMPWPSRNSKVVCGGTVNGEVLQMRISTDDVLTAESTDERVLVFVDLHKPGQVRFLISEAITDAEYATREAAMAKLTDDEAKVLRELTSSRETDIEMGLVDGFVNLSSTSKNRTYNLSCQEFPDAGT